MMAIKNKFCVLICFLIFIAQTSAQQLAFPTAEGYGKYAVGGRGGKVVEVTNLNDSGPGSFRYALESVSGARTIIFKIGGVIDLKSRLNLDNDSYVTIAGQTAPGDGICIKNYPLMITNSQHIIVRFIRSRLGDQGSPEDDCISVRGSTNVILDHCSLSWSIDSILDVTHNSGKVTVQYCILSEPLVESSHAKGSHGYAAGWDGKGGSTYHHNLIASAVSRTPRLDKYLNDDGSKDLIEVVNNVIYNWTSYGAYGGEEADVNWLNNYYRYGSETSSDRRDWVFGAGANIQMYVDGNFMFGYPDVTEDNSLGINYDGKNLQQIRADVLVSEPFHTMGINTETAPEAYKTVLSNAGALQPKRDAVDTRIVQDVINGTGQFIDSQEEVGGWPTYSSGAVPVDGDHDGMADDWEDTNGLDKTDASDRNSDADSDGYTNLEEYLNELVVFEDSETIEIPPVPVLKVEVVNETGTDLLYINGPSIQLSAQVFPEEAAIKEIKWTVNTEGIVSVDDNGLVSAISPGSVAVFATATDGSGVKSFEMVRVSELLLSSDQRNAMHIYPNPVYNEVRVKTEDKIRMLQLHNLAGKLLVTTEKEYLELTGIASGIYLLKVFTNKGVEVLRLVKQ